MMTRLRLTTVALCLALGAVLVSSAAAFATPSVAVVSSANPSTYGQRIVLTARVTDPTRPVSQITGTMAFTDEEALLGTAVVTNGKATLSDSALDAGSDPITATFSPAGGGPAIASAPFPQAVNTADTAITVVSSSPTADYFKAGNITATVKSVAPAPARPTGSVEFLVNGWFWSAPLDSTGKATLPLSEVYPSFYPGSYSVTASYSGSADFNGSTTPTAITQTLVGISAPPVSTISLTAKGQPVFTPSSFKLSSANPVGCNVAITNSTPIGVGLLYGTPGLWKVLPGGGIAAGGTGGVGVGLSNFTGYFTVRGASNYVAVKCV
jgi:hypothetical protein